MANTNQRPVFLDLLRIRQPVAAVLSILHRLSGAVLFLILPIVVYLFDLSLQSPQGYAQAAAILAHPAMKVVLLGVLWAMVHHLFAGIRFLLIDLDLGVEIQKARKSAWVVNIGAVVVTVLLALRVLI